MSVPELNASSPAAAASSGASGKATVTRACSSCGRTLIGWGIVMFSCPSCGSQGLGRCAQCRDQSVPYRCPNCQFQGP